MTNKEATWQASPSQITNIAFYIICLCVPLLLPFAIWKFLVTKKTKYMLTSTRLKTETGVLNIKRENLELRRVRDYSIEEPLLLRMFGLGHVILETTDRTHPYFKIKAIKNPQAVAEQIYSGSTSHHIQEVEVVG